MTSEKNDIILLTHDLTVYNGRHRGILGVDVSVKKGDIFEFLGPNGVGKTVLQCVFFDGYKYIFVYAI